MPAGLTTVGGYAFLGCSDLTTIEMPAGLTSIGWDAFFGGQTVLRRFSLEDILHVCDGSMPPVSINGNTSPFYIEVIQDSMEVGAVSHQYKELYFWFGKRGMKTIET